MELNVKERLLTLKIVYYGTALGGKTTNLQTIHALTDKERRVELVSIATRDDRTLFFDLLPIGLGKFFGYELRLKLFTVPGQVQFDVTRRKVLGGADAVVFVADSQKSQTAPNALSIKNLRINLIQNKLDPKTIPLVIQYNKRDLPDISTVDEMDAALNDNRSPSFPAIAIQGPGVMECLATAVSIAIEQLAPGHKLTSQAEAKRAANQVRDALMVFAVKGASGSAVVGGGGSTQRAALSGASTSAGAGTSAGGLSSPFARAGTGMGSSMSAAGGRVRGPDGASWVYKADVKVTDEVDVLEQAVQANLALSDKLAGMHLATGRIQRREQQVRALGTLARLAEEVSDPSRMEMELLTNTLSALGLPRGSLLSKAANAPIATRCVAGHATDPLLGVPSPPMSSVAERMIAAGRVHLFNDVPSEILFGEQHPSASGIYSLVFSPLRMADGSFGGLFLYGCDTGEPFDANDELFVEAACRIFSLSRLRTLAPAGR